MSECSSEEKCCCPCHARHEQCHEEEDNHDKGSYFYELADQAWEEVLLEKMKKHILDTQDKRMSELAKIVAEGNNQRWRNKMEKKRGCMEMQEQLMAFFSRAKK